MIRQWWQRLGAGSSAFGLILIAGISVCPHSAADDGADEHAGEPRLQQQLGAVFYRSMAKWRYDYSKMPTGKAGVACIPWARLDDAFLNEGIYEALGFSYSMAREETAIEVATQGCDKMKAHYRLSDCNCEVVLVGDTVVVEIPE